MKLRCYILVPERFDLVGLSDLNWFFSSLPAIDIPKTHPVPNQNGFSLSNSGRVDTSKYGRVTTLQSLIILNCDNLASIPIWATSLQWFRIMSDGVGSLKGLIWGFLFYFFELWFESFSKLRVFELMMLIFIFEVFLFYSFFFCKWSFFLFYSIL